MAGERAEADLVGEVEQRGLQGQGERHAREGSRRLEHLYERSELGACRGAAGRASARQTVPVTMTLAVDCGGTGLKASVLDESGTLHAKPIRVPTPYPLPIDRFLDELADLAATRCPRPTAPRSACPG